MPITGKLTHILSKVFGYATKHDSF